MLLDSELEEGELCMELLWRAHTPGLSPVQCFDWCALQASKNMGQFKQNIHCTCGVISKRTAASSMQPFQSLLRGQPSPPGRRPLCSYYSSDKEGLLKELATAYRSCRSRHSQHSESQPQQQIKQLLALVVRHLQGHWWPKGSH